jgi:peptidoglycan/LPS O-acetylase OafA/YrhL
MSALISKFSYRPEVDGLRAVAVMAVVLFHAGLRVPGGYIGVDVFFVISGYLITSLIIKDLEAGKFSFWKFWERRIRRILPALTVMVLSVLALGWFLLLPDDYANLGKSAMWQALFAANIYFWKNSDYFSPAAEEQPLLHTWSLAVEEQFYFLVPVGLFILFRFAFFRRRSILLTVLTIGALVSLALSIRGIATNDISTTFYLLPTRAWELMLGSILAITPTRIIPRSQWGREIMSYVGIAGILIPCLVYNADTPFPGLTALPVCLGSFLYILSNQHYPHNQSLTHIGKLLATRPVVFVGLISYSLYLWHWPLFAFNTYWSFGSNPWYLRVGLVITSFIFAILSWRFIETPFRVLALFQNKRVIYTFGVCAITTLSLLGWGIHVQHGFTHRVPPAVLLSLEAKNDFLPRRNVTTDDIRQGDVISLGNSTEEPSILLWGDSHARAMIPAFHLLANEYGIAGAAITHSSSRPIIGNYQGIHGVKDPIEWCRAVIDYIQKHSIKDTFLVGFWGGYHVNPDKNTYQKDLRHTINAITTAGSRVWIIHQVPAHPYRVPEFIAKQAIIPSPIHWLKGNHIRHWTLDKHLQKTSVTRLEPIPDSCILLDPTTLFLSSESSPYLDIVKHDIVLYQDKDHLTQTAVEQLIYPWLSAQVKEHPFLK